MYRVTAILLVSLAAVVAIADTGKPRTHLNMRAAPTSRTDNVIAVLRPSEEFEILETKRGWYRVRVLKSGREGWVAQKHVRRMPVSPPAAPEVAVRNESAGTPLLVFAVLIVALLATSGYVGSPRGRPVSLLVISAAIGFFYVTLTLPKALITVGTQRASSMTLHLGEWGLSFNHRLSASLPGFASAMESVFWATLVYLLSLLLLSLRHGQFGLFKWGSATLLISVVSFHAIAWAGYIAVKIVTFVFWIFGAIAFFIGTVFAFCWQSLASLAMWFYGLLQQWLGELWWVPGVVVAVALIAVVLGKSGADLGVLLKAAASLLAVVAVAVAALFPLRWIWRVIAPWVIAVLKFLETVFRFLFLLVGRLLIFLAVLLVFATIGQLLLDQVKGAWSAGRRQRGVIVGALAIGTSIAILLFVSNVYGVTAWLPSPVTRFAVEYLHQPAPLLDALIAFAIVGLSIVGVWRNMLALGEEPTVEEFGKSLVYAIVGVFVAGGLTAIAGQTEE